MEQKDPIAEARRYMENAKTILKEKAIKDGDFYKDSKYVKMAGHTMWTGCLLALDYALKIPARKDGRKDIADYKTAATKADKKLLSYVVSGYNTMHLSMSYDGEKTVNLAQISFDTMKFIINWCETRTKKK